MLSSFLSPYHSYDGISGILTSPLILSGCGLHGLETVSRTLKRLNQASIVLDRPLGKINAFELQISKLCKQRTNLEITDELFNDLELFE